MRPAATAASSTTPISNTAGGRLLLAPEPVLEYVVVHELLHLREPNHTKAFWRLVEAARPGWREQPHWLRLHGRELRDYDVATALPED